MSLVTDLVFVTPSVQASMRFADLFAASPHGRHSTSWRPAEMDSNGSKCSGTHVYHMGVNYLDWDFVDAVKTEPWPAGTVLYLYPEEDADPTVKVWRGDEGEETG